MIYSLLIIFAVLVTVFILFKIGDAFSPWMLTSAVWLSIFLLFALFGDNLYPLRDRLFNCVMIWTPIIIFTSILTFYALPSTEDSCIEKPIETSHYLYKLLFIIAMVCSPLYFYQMIKMALMFDMDNLLNNIRIFSNYGQKDTLMSLLKYISPINQALFIVEIWKYPNTSKWRFTAIIVSNILCTIAIMSKTPIFILTLSTLYIMYEKGKIQIKNIIISVVAILLLFYEFNNLRNAGAETEKTTFLDFFSMYILSPSVAFEWAQEKLIDQFGTFSFAFFYAFLTKLGIGNYYVQNQLQEFVFVPVPTNIYTVFQPYFEDFGYKGVAFFASVWGLLTGWMYRLVINGNPLAKCLYTYFIFALVMQFYQESLFVNLSTVIQFTIIFSMLIKHDTSITLDFSKKYINSTLKTKE